MLSRQQLTNRQLRSALETQAISGRRLGECLEKLGFASEQQVTAALGLQWACPVLTLRDFPDWACADRLPYRLLESFRMLPVQFVAATRTFHIAFCDDIDYRALFAIGQMLDCHTEACLISRSAMDRALEQIGRERGPGDFLFEGWRQAPEMARITCSYVLKLGARDVRVVTCGGIIWARLNTGKDVAHLLFRRPVAAIEQFTG
jgi:Type II secretion system (T2SS), protein E, N-terminal domain